MADEKIKKLFIEHCICKKERVFLSQPMNTKHEAQYRTFKIGLLLGEKA